MPEGQSGLDRVYQQTTSTDQAAPPPGAPPLPLSSGGPVVTSGPPASGGGAQLPAGHAGYISPEEQTQRNAQVIAGQVMPNPAGIMIATQQVAQDLSATAAVAGGGFKMDIDAMRSLQPDWQAIADKLSDMIQKAQLLPHLRQPAEDPGSTLQIQSAKSHAAAYLASLNQQRSYAQGYADQLKKAIDAYEKQDQAHSRRLRKQG